MCLAVPARIVSLHPHRLATVDVGGARRTVSLDLVDDVKPGDYVIVHVGFAIQRLDEAQALQTLRWLEEMARASGGPQEASGEIPG